MQRINLKTHYPEIHKKDHFIDVSDQVAKCLKKWRQREHNYREKTRYWRAYYSLDRGDGIENDAIEHAPSAEHEHEQLQFMQNLHSELALLPKEQARRIYAHYVLGIRVSEIAEQENVNRATVYRSIFGGLKSINVNNL